MLRAAKHEHGELGGAQELLNFRAPIEGLSVVVRVGARGEDVDRH